MGQSKIINIADIQSLQNKNIDQKRKMYSVASEHCNNELEELTEYIEKFCNAISNKYIIADSFSIGNTLKECFESMKNSFLVPIINGSNEMQERLGSNDYTKMRVEIYNDIIEKMKERGLVE